MDKKQLSQILTARLNKEIVVKAVTLVGSGYHSKGYKITTQHGDSYFIKKITSDELGFEFPERKIMSLLVSHAMLSRHAVYPGSLGVAVKNKTMELLPDVDDNTEIYHIQEFGGKGRSYFELLEQDSDKQHVGRIDKARIDQVVNFIARIHSKRPNYSAKKLKIIYNDYLRSVIGHPEYLLMILQRIPKDNPVLSPDHQGKFISLMLENMHHFRDRYDRVRALHGDFWGANLFFREDGSVFVIDYSRLPWGDPGFDVGVWMSQYVFRYHAAKTAAAKRYYKQLGNYFLKKYIQKTGDRQVLNTLYYSLAVVAAIYASEASIPGIKQAVRKAFYNHVCRMLKNRKFSW